MAVLTAHLALLAALSTTVPHLPSYVDAYNQAQAQRQPLLVLVGSDSCPDYQKLKTELLPVLLAQGELSDVACALVDQEQHPKMARQLQQDNAVTQLVLYTRVGQQWWRSQMTNVQSSEDICAFVKRNRAGPKTPQAESATPTMHFSSGGG